MPTFLYDIHNLHVEERPSTEFQRDDALLRRDVQFTADSAPRHLFFRAAVGDSIEKSGDGYLVDDKLTFKFQSPSDVKPFVREVDGKQELLVPIQLAKSGNQHDLELSVEMKW